MRPDDEGDAAARRQAGRWGRSGIVDRRSLLVRVGVGLLAPAIAGCTGTDGTGPRIVGEPGLRETGRRCGTEDEGDVAIEWRTQGDPEVVITGAVVGPDGCAGARLAAATYDAASDALDVVIETVTEPDTAPCQECLTVISYVAAVRFVGGLPDTVVVTHRGVVEERSTATRTG